MRHQTQFPANPILTIGLIGLIFIIMLIAQGSLLALTSNVNSSPTSSAVGDLRIIRGTIEPNGHISSGSGFSVQWEPVPYCPSIPLKPGEILKCPQPSRQPGYYITFDTPFSQLPTITASLHWIPDNFVTLQGIPLTFMPMYYTTELTSDSVLITIKSLPDGHDTTVAFSFIAVGSP
jgi:hypothetical protein